MKDPFAPETPYDYFDVSTDATPDEMEQAFNRSVEKNPEKAFEAAEMWDKLRNPETRLMLDIFQYQGSAENVPDDNFAFELPPIEAEDITRLEQRLMDELKERGRAVNLGAAKPILDLKLEQ